MKNFLIATLFILAAGQLCRFGLPWWAVAPIAAIAGWAWAQSAAKSLLAGFCGGFLLWLTAALFLDMANEGLLSGRVGKLFMGLSGTGLLLITGLLGGLLGALGALTGRWARDLVGQPAKVS